MMNCVRMTVGVVGACWCCGRSGKFQVRLCVVNKKFSYEEYDEMH